MVDDPDFVLMMLAPIVVVFVTAWLAEPSQAAQPGSDGDRPGRLEPAQTLQGAGISVRIGHRGAVEIERGQDRYRVESSFSCPGEAIGFNRLSEGPASGEASWTPRVAEISPTAARITAEGTYYSVERRVEVSADRITFTDTLANRSDEDVGILIHHKVVLGQPAGEPLLGGVPVSTKLDESATRHATNPTIFLQGKASSLGVVGEDTLTRIQLEGRFTPGEVGYALEHFALKPGTSRTFRWAIYCLDAGTDYFAFINRVRRDWSSNHTVEGPFEFGPPQDVWKNPARLKAYLSRKRIKFAAAGPWLDYDNGWLSLGMEEQREKYKQMLMAAKAALKAADPDIEVVGNLEGPIVSIPWELSRALWEALPPDQRQPGYPKPFTDKQRALMKTLPIKQKDSLLQGPNGEQFYELYYRGDDGKLPLMAVVVLPAPGNGQMNFLMEQARFIMDQVGLDGIYLDGTCPVRDGRYSYGQWDGVTVDIDAQTGHVTRRYTDGTLVMGDVPCTELFTYVLDRGGTMIGNGHHYSEQTQAIPMPRFQETGGAYDPLAIGKGQKPPFVPVLHQYCHLGAPVALANPVEAYGENATRNYAEFVMKSVITHLRHGVLFYYFNTEIPEEGPGSGAYGPVNHMFPTTAIELHEGWILGKERIITARSIDDVAWEKDGKPIVTLFDIKGREVKGRDIARIAERAGTWSVSIALNDWEEIAVVE